MSVITCERCGEPAPAGSQPNKRFCSEACRLGAEWARQSEKRRAARENARVAARSAGCGQCGGPIPSEARAGARYCSRQCARRASKARTRLRAGSLAPNTVANCAVCGGDFVMRQPNQMVCSDPCKVQRACEARKPEGYRRPRECRECCQTFSPAYRDKRRVFCSDECSGRSAARVRRCVERAREFGSSVIENVDPIRVFERDGWRCQRCGTETPRDLLGANKPNSPEMDHVIALSRGGEHTYRNTQCLCRSCNGLKARTDDKAAA